MKDQHLHASRHMGRLLLVILLLATHATAHAQQEETIDITIHDGAGGSRVETFELPASMTFPLDSLMADWRTRSYINVDQECNASNTNPTFSDSVYIDRLSRIPAIIEMPYNEIVRQFIDTYTIKQRRRMSLMLGLCNFYLPLFEEALLAYDLPLELKYLPIVESGLNPKAVSRARTTGLWQFTNGTGKIYGLENSNMVDERLDPIKSTWAAARLLKDMYSIYNDWALALAAYNCGPGNVNKAINRSGGKTDYWEIYNYLPRETRAYLPAFIAINYVMTYYCQHNICPMEASLPEDTDTIQVHQNVHFQQIAQVCGIEEDVLKSLNPQYKRSIVPGLTKPQTLRLPQKQIETFLQHEDSVYAYRANVYFRNRKVVDTPPPAKSNSRNTRATIKAGAKTHTIQRGETLSAIAKKYGVSVQQLRNWNGISGSQITAGKKLIVGN